MFNLALKSIYEKEPNLIFQDVLISRLSKYVIVSFVIFPLENAVTSLGIMIHLCTKMLCNTVLKIVKLGEHTSANRVDINSLAISWGLTNCFVEETGYLNAPNIKM